ncbi:retrovirus-related pol polyprotein from transposon TNT 1-94 [Tanacetum coccineum]
MSMERQWRKDEVDKTKDETCLVEFNRPMEICLGIITLEPDEWIKDSGCSKHMTGKTPYELLRGRKPNLNYFKVFGSKCFILNTKDYLTKFDPKSYEGVFLGCSQNSKAYIILNKQTMKVKESLNVTFDENPLPPKTSPLEDDDLVEEEAIEVMAMQEELNQFISNDVWELFPNPMDMTIIGTKWVYRNKLDENGVVTRNKARLVAQGYNQQEGIDYDKTNAPVARLESIRILLAYACALNFKLFKMNVKSAFINGFINEEVYVAQPPGFIDFTKPNHVYRLKKELYGVKQAPKAWYDRLKAFLIKHDYTMGMKQTALAISTAEAKYASAGKACQQALWMKQALVDYGISTNDNITLPGVTNMLPVVMTISTSMGTVAYKLELPQQLSMVHSTFHVSNLKKFLSDEPLEIPLDEIHIDDKLHFIEEPVEIMDREVKQLKQSRIPIIKVRWNTMSGPEFTWEREDQF